MRLSPRRERGTQHMKRILPVIVFLLALLPLPAMTTVTAVTGLGYLSDFAFGTITAFPSSAAIEQSAEDFHFIDSMSTDLVMRMSFGLEKRRLLQNLEDGDYLSISKDDTWYDYSVFHSAVSYRLDNHLFEDEHTGEYLLNFSAGFSFRFEQAFESLYNMRRGNASMMAPSDDGTVPAGFIRNSENRLFLNSVATPDFNGNGYLLSSSFILAGKYDHMYKAENRIFRQGMEANLSLQLAPWWFFNSLPWFFDGKSDFYKLAADVQNALILYNRSDERGKSTLTLVVDNTLSTQLLFGSAVPHYADTLTFYSLTDGMNLSFIIRDSVKFYIYGPSFFTDDTLPYMYLFLDGGYAAGHLNNSTVSALKQASFLTGGIHLRLIFMGAMNICAECSYTLSASPAYIEPFQWGLYAYFAME